MDRAVAVIQRLVDSFYEHRDGMQKRLSRREKRYAVSLAVISSGLLLGLIDRARRRRLQQAEDEKHSKTLHRRNSAVLIRDGSYEIFVPYKDGHKSVIINPIRNIVYEAHRRLFLDQRTLSAEGKVGINKRFWKQFSAIWAVIVPRINCKEVGLLLLHFLFLIARTLLSVVVARIDGRIVRDLVSANGKGFLRGLLYWIAIAIPASYTNSVIRFMQAKISIAFRTRLIRYIHDLYLNDNLAYYKVPNLDAGIQGVDQFITTDVTKFCDIAASILSNLGKPTIDMVVFNYQLFKSLGSLATCLILCNYVGTAWILRRVSPSFGKLAAREARLEGDFRNAHARIITNAEEIAFYEGANLEKSILEKTYGSLIGHINRVLRVRISYNMFEDFTIKYAWSAFGLILASFPTFFPLVAGFVSKSASPSDVQQSRAQHFVTNKRLMMSLADAGGRIMYSYKDLAELAGYTYRVFALLNTLHRVHAHDYHSTEDTVSPPYTLADVQGTIQTG